MNKKESRFHNWKLPKVSIPKLKFLYRILLYFITIVFATLSIVNVVLESFPFGAGIAIYVCAALTLTASCYYIVVNIRHSVKERIIPGIEANPFTNRIKKDYRYRTFTFASFGGIIGILFALFNGVIGLISLSPWFGTLAAYYLLLSVMRIAVLHHNRKSKQKENRKQTLLEEIAIYKRCGVIFIFLAIVLSGMVVLLLVSEGGKHYPGVTIYAVAAYAFYKITISIINVVKTRRMKSPLLMAIRDIGFVDASVSILSLQTAMFAAFGNGDTLLVKIMNGMTGAAVILIICVTAIYELVTASKMKGKRKRRVRYD